MTHWLIPLLLLQAAPGPESPLAAVARWEKARAAAPANPENAYQLGRAYERLAQWAVQRIRDKDPGAARLHQWIGEGHARQGQIGPAIAA
ncbi:MAG TPA: hypothetical protein DEH78_09885, partial [Solibacterales bacterium]|nr:hypothetical protein [Bryobacterales bacterium]